MRTDGSTPSEVPGRFSAPTTIRECAERDAGAWDAFVERSNGTYCHLYAWKRVFERVYGLKTLYLSFQCKDEWLGVLPLAIMPRLPGQPAKAISVPYCNYGGLATVAGGEPGDLRAIAVEYLLRRGVRCIEFRETATSSSDGNEVSMLLRLPASSEHLWSELHDKSQIRKAQRAGVTPAWGREYSRSLYDIYARRMGELGTPVHSWRFVQEILDGFGDCADVLTVQYQERPIGAMLVIKFKDTWADPMASSLTDFRGMNPNMLLYWEALRAACEAGAKYFDFGRSQRDSGTYRFKKQWGAEEVLLHYYSYRDAALVNSAATNFYRGRGASALVRGWKMLPGAVQRTLGPVIRRWVP